MFQKFVVFLWILIFMLCGEVFVTETRAQCGTFFRPSYRAVGKLNGSFFQTGDWTGDGKSDFYTFRQNSSTQTQDVLIYPSKATGYWDWDNPLVYTTTIPVSAILSTQTNVLKDFNSDGRIDFLFGDRIYKNNGNGTLTALAPIVITSPAFLGTIGYFDMNGDNLLDWLYWVSINPTGQEIRYQTANADGSFNPAVTLIAHNAQNNLNNAAKAAGDFDGDGKLDIVYGTVFGSNRKYFFMKGMGNGTFQMGSAVATNSGDFTDVKDFNNDGRADILSVRNYPTRLFVLFGQTNGTFTETELPVRDGEHSTYFFASELNGDNNLDVIELTTHLDNYSVYLNNGNGSFPRSDYPKYFNRADMIEDFNADGKADFIQLNHKNIFGDNLLVVSENNCQTFGETAKANFGVDRLTDMVVWNPNNGNWSYRDATWTIFSGTNFSQLNWGLGSLGDVPAPGDYDGDGKTDTGVFRQSNGTWYVRQSSNGAWMVLNFGLNGDIAVPNDYDGGGKTDIAVFRPSNGNWYIWLTETQQFKAINFGTNGDKPVPADYDGDRITDAAVFRPSNGTWYYLKSSDSNYGAINWGIATDKPVPADYDGDGKADVAVFRDGSWYILRSMNNSFNAIQWGMTGDFPVGFYRNGVSAEVVVYRSSQRVWFNWAFNGLGPITEQFGGAQDVPIYFGLPNN